MRRLTVDMIMKAPAFRNTLKERELDLRGLKIPRIENLGVTQDQFDVIDLSNNQIEVIEDMPHLERLTTLLFNNNMINRMTESFTENCPNIRALMLTNNNIREFKEITPLMKLTHLEHLSLVQNPINDYENYRLICIKLFPSLKYLDFQKVTMKEREDAKNVLSEQ